MLNGTTGGAFPQSIMQAADGNFYGVMAGAGAAGTGGIFKLTPAGAFTLLYSFPGSEYAYQAGRLAR